MNTFIPPVQPDTPICLDWADRRWRDPLTGTEVLRLSPPENSHFRNPYFRINMCTGDGEWMVISEFKEITDGREQGPVVLRAINLRTGEYRYLEGLPAKGSTWNYCVAMNTHRVLAVDNSNPERQAIVIIDIDTGEKRRIEPSRPIHAIYTPALSGDERYTYTPIVLEKHHLQREMGYHSWFRMMTVEPGLQEMVRIDLETGEVQTLFEADTWYVGHPNPHPADTDLLMCCQTWNTRELSNQWGSVRELERIRVYEISTGTWKPTWRTSSLPLAHEHWALKGHRIYSHKNVDGYHGINRIDLDAGTNEWFFSPDGYGLSHHVTISPNEGFLVGDGLNFDRTRVSPELRRRVEAFNTEDILAIRIKDEINQPAGGETIWQYRLPKETLRDYPLYAENPGLIGEELAQHPEKTVIATPVCRFRSLQRGPMFGRRLESNAHVMPDNRWVVFQSSSEDGMFEVWAARIPRPG
jgi:hypothetical protein